MKPSDPDARPGPEAGERPSQRRPYRRPRLVDFGDLRALTLGGSRGFGDSGNPGSFDLPTGFGPGPSPYPPGRP